MQKTIHTPYYEFQGHKLRGFVRIEPRKTYTHIHWDIGTLDNYAETSNAIRYQQEEKFKELFDRYHVWMPSLRYTYRCSRWGRLTVLHENVDAVVTFLTTFWFDLIATCLKGVAK